MDVIIWILLATLINGLVAFIGVFALGLSEKLFNELLMTFVAFSAGALLSGAFFHIIPEVSESLQSMTLSIYIMAGFVLFFIIERILHWHHCHDEHCETHHMETNPVSYLVLFGDAIHNFVDGAIISAAFVSSISLGIFTTLVIIAHEIPQELGDFAVLVHGGMKKKKALIFNFLSQLTCVLGGIFGYFLSSKIQGAIPIMLAFAAGGFIYVAASDLIPELHKEPKLKKALLSFLFFLAGLGLMILLKSLFGE